MIRRSLSLRPSLLEDSASDMDAEDDANVSDNAGDGSGLGFIIITAVFQPVASVAHASQYQSIDQSAKNVRVVQVT